MVVLVIILVASSLALLAYGNFRRSATVRSDAEKIKAILVAARTRAIADGKPSSVLFDLDTQQMWVDDLEANGDIRRPKAVPVEFINPDVLLESVRLGATTQTTGQARVTFTPEGTNAFVTVLLRRQKADTAVDTNYYSVQLYPSSSEPRVWAYERR